MSDKPKPETTLQSLMELAGIYFMFIFAIGFLVCFLK
jgi:hypothetical protein